MPYSARVLVICDEDAHRDTLQATLEARGYEALAAATRADALELARRHHPDIAVIRAGRGEALTDLAGELTRYLKSVNSVLRYPVIVLGDASEASADIEGRIAYAYHDMQLFNRIESLVRLDTMGRELKRRLETLNQFGVTDLAPVGPPQALDDVRVVVAGAASADFSEIERILKASGVHVVAALTPATTLDYLAAESFDAVLLNINGDAVDWLSVSETMRRNPKLYNIPVIVVADLAQLGPPEEAYRDGVSDIVAKPVSATELSKRVEALVREARFRSALQDVYARSRHNLTNDALTGLFTYGFLHAHIETVVADSLRTNQDLTVAFFDIEGMARINEAHGYAIGDAVIRQVGSMIGMLVRGEDIPARYGGAEFALILPNTSEDVAHYAIQRILGVINNTLFPSACEQTAIPVTLKCGIASLWAGETGASLLQKARAQARTP